MRRWRGILAAACTAVLSGSVYAQIGMFDGNLDLGDPGTDPGPTGAGSVSYDGSGTYTVWGGGSDWWDGGERGQYVYKQISGNFRLEADIRVLAPDPANPDWSTTNDWAKYGLAFRNDINVGGAAAKQVNAFMAALRPDRRGASLQARYAATDNNMNNSDMWNIDVQKLAIQRTSTPWGYYVEGFAFANGGWQKVGSRLMGNMAGNAYVGLAVTSHDNDPNNAQVDLAAAEFRNVTGSANVVSTFPTVGVATRITGDLNALAQSGIKIHTIKNPMPWGYDWGDQLLKNGSLNFPGVEEGTRIDQVVNLHDSGGRGNFDNDSSYPGIDPFEQPTKDPAAGDDDNNFATEATGYIALTKGLHRIGVASDDGTIITIGGVEVGRTNEWKGADTWDFIFNVQETGVYAFRALNIEGGGGASFELSDFDGSQRVLLNMGGMKIGQAVPEPAALGLLALGALGLLARRRKA